MPKTDGLRFDENGPSLDGVRLTRRTKQGWQPTEREIIERELVTFAGLATGTLINRLDRVCRAMNLGDFATAAIAAEHATRDMKRRSVRAVAKASPDDPKHPGWPAGTPDGKGGEFMPKDAAAPEVKEARLKRLATRRSLRSVLRRVLTFKRVARLTAVVLGDSVPGLDAISGAASLVDAVKLAEDMAADAAATDAAIAFAEKGPQALEDLQVSAEHESFSSFAAFKKLDLAASAPTDLEKRFGPAGNGYEYHHIVEQGPNSTALSAQDLNSTENIVRIPRLLHEEVTAAFTRKGTVNGAEVSLRDFLRDQPVSVQRKWGLKALQDVGVLQ